MINSGGKSRNRVECVVDALQSHHSRPELFAQSPSRGDTKQARRRTKANRAVAVADDEADNG